MAPEFHENYGESEIRIQPKSDVQKATNDSASVLGEIVNHSLIYIKTSKNVSTRHRIGEYELFDPDYRFVCAMAEDLLLSPEETLNQLLLTKDIPASFSTRIVNYRFKSIHIYKEILPLSSIPIIEGLTVEYARINLKGILSSAAFLTFPELKELHCDNNELESLNLSSLVKLEILNCNSNKLYDLNISNLTRLSMIGCSGNKLSILDLSHNKKLDRIACGWNELDRLNLPNSKNIFMLHCKENNLTNLDISKVSNIEQIICDKNNISILNIAHLSNLKNLTCDNSTQLIKRPDQHF
jgi:hypothetical protein